jgi:hypothetical protein
LSAKEPTSLPGQRERAKERKRERKTEREREKEGGGIIFRKSMSNSSDVGFKFCEIGRKQNVVER